MMVLAVLVAIAIAVPAFAVEFQYGGMYRLRFQGKNNVRDGLDTDKTVYNYRGERFDSDDASLWIDQRLRLFFTFVASERLQLVTKWEVDTQWGDAPSGGDVGADSVNYEMKNVYLDFMIPYTPTRARVGVQGFTPPGVGGWIVDDDFSMVRLTTPIDPVTIDIGYIGARNEDVTDEGENIDDWLLNIGYASGPFSGNLTFFYQYAHNNGTSTFFADQDLIFAYEFLGRTPQEFVFDDNQLFDLGINLAYDADWMAAHVNSVINFGDYDVADVIEIDGQLVADPRTKRNIDYKGWMIEAGADFFYQNWTFSLGGFFTSGTDVEDFLRDKDDNGFAYPLGRSYYWSEILGLGTLDVNVGGTRGSDRIVTNGGYKAGDGPSNLWTIMAGVAWQAMPTTKLTLNYWYVQTHKDVFSDIVFDAHGNLIYADTDKSIGHELNFYVDQEVVDGLQLRLVGAYLFADDAYTVFRDDDDTYEVGAQLMWSF
jgi:hypothetical protein